MANSQFRDDIDKLKASLGKSIKADIKPEDIEKAERQEQSLEHKQREAELDRYLQDTTHRRSLVTWAATVVSFWLICVIFILTRNTLQYKLSDTIMVALLGTTTINVLGLMIIVLNDLFKGKKEDNKPS
ncbi:hypothetical protein AM493_13980 [Flavobacterium akiainvivens]|uniref:Uncharacterized protein n=1 Tax=Flavobacterium akiainvivens TaxID=1202724 RepID=A0A0M8MJD5_9FLAO|nr:hypothetical protein [Flavobacterium akiainvivens]KOS07017.1 hypothetical protein AM493_13980 [Flavobacterium akiainvivens]SFQ59120.1 hypothetical protein SAMN05444144_10978 [Flavobacterium akiainvivens]